MPSKKRGGDILLFSSDDPEPLVKWLCDTYGLQTILRSVAQYQPTGAEAPAKRAYKKRGPKKGSKRGSKRGSKKGGRRGGKAGAGGGGGGASEVGNG